MAAPAPTASDGASTSALGITEIIEAVFTQVHRDALKAAPEGRAWAFQSRPLKEFASHACVRRCWIEPAKTVYLSQLNVGELTFSYGDEAFVTPASALGYVTALVFDAYEGDPARYEDEGPVGVGLAALLRQMPNLRSLTMRECERAGCIFGQPLMQLAVRKALKLQHIRLVTPDGASQIEDEGFQGPTRPSIVVAGMAPGLRLLDISFDVGYKKKLPAAGTGPKTLEEVRLAIQPGWEIYGDDPRTEIKVKTVERLTSTFKWLVANSPVHTLDLAAERWSDRQITSGADEFGEAFAAGVLPLVAGSLTHLRLVDDSKGRMTASGLAQHMPTLANVETLELGGFKVENIGLDRMQPTALRQLRLALDDAADAAVLQLVEAPAIGRLRTLHIATMQPTNPSRWGGKAAAKALDHGVGFGVALEEACAKRDIRVALS